MKNREKILGKGSAQPRVKIVLIDRKSKKMLTKDKIKLWETTSVSAKAFEWISQKAN